MDAVKKGIVSFLKMALWYVIASVIDALQVFLTGFPLPEWAKVGLGSLLKGIATIVATRKAV